MNEQEKQAYLEAYQRAKQKGVPFFPERRCSRTRSLH